MATATPSVIVLAGPNGAGKTTVAPQLLRDVLGVVEFVNLTFFWLPSADFAVARVADRMRLGGHSVPEETIRRRYHAGLRNFFRLYQPLTTTWTMFDNADWTGMRKLAAGRGRRVIEITNEAVWRRIEQEHAYGN